MSILALYFSINVSQNSEDFLGKVSGFIFFLNKGTFRQAMRSIRDTQPYMPAVSWLSQVLLSNLAHLQFTVDSATIFTDRLQTLMDFSLPYTGKLNSISDSIRKADNIYIRKQARQGHKGAKQQQRFSVHQGFLCRVAGSCQQNSMSRA